jgi:alkylhydroperoxidase/carboxymuconolactone decarboxylase family protein YurZ
VISRIRPGSGAAKEEIRHVGLLALTTVGLPRMMAGLSWIDDVLKAALGGKRRIPKTRPE